MEYFELMTMNDSFELFCYLLVCYIAMSLISGRSSLAFFSQYWLTLFSGSRHPYYSVDRKQNYYDDVGSTSSDKMSIFPEEFYEVLHPHCSLQ